MTALAPDTKTCCAAVYGSEALRFLVGESLHPGGAGLTRHLAASLAVGRGDVVLDVASGGGASGAILARETGCRVVGLDLALDALVRAAGRAEGERPSLVAGDAEALPLRDASVGGVLCECALCLFPDASAAAREVARVLRPGARLALSDVTAVPARLPPELRSFAARVACVAGARPLDEIAALLAAAGLAVESVERHDDALRDLLGRIAARLRLARLVGNGIVAAYADTAAALLAAAEAALADGALGYGVVIARR